MNSGWLVEFRLVVFRPFKGEIIEGVIVGSTPHGITGISDRGYLFRDDRAYIDLVSLEFFEDVFIPQELLFEGTEW